MSEKKILTKNDVIFHPISSSELFWYDDRLFRIEKEHNCIFDLMNIKSNIIQPIYATNFCLDLNGIFYNFSTIANLYEHKIYHHRIRISELPKPRVKKMIIDLCKLMIETIPYNIIFTDIHEGNINDTIDGIKWLDYGAFSYLNDTTSKTAFVLVGYFVYKYLLDVNISDHEHICLNDIRNLGGDFATLVDLDFKQIKSWTQTINVINNISTNLEASHWSDNYSNTMDIDHPETLGTKGINIWNILQKLDYETVTDVACNKGYYSFLAAKKAKSVLGFDLIPACIDKALAFNENFKLPVVFGVKKIEDIYRNKMFETFRFKSDLVMALAIVHHISNVISPAEFVKMLHSICNKYVLIEDIGTMCVYQALFEQHGFVLQERLESTPSSRTLSLYRKL